MARKKELEELLADREAEIIRLSADLESAYALQGKPLVPDDHFLAVLSELAAVTAPQLASEAKKASRALEQFLAYQKEVRS